MGERSDPSRGDQLTVATKIVLFDQWVRAGQCNWGKTPGKQVQHMPASGTASPEISHFSAIKHGSTRCRSMFARGFAPITRVSNRSKIPGNGGFLYSSRGDYGRR
jgi:hypothetical protein